MEGSKVWYLRRDEKAFYPCVVDALNVSTPKATLFCDVYNPRKVLNVNWEDIFPMESTVLIKDMGTFKINKPANPTVNASICRKNPKSHMDKSSPY